MSMNPNASMMSGAGSMASAAGAASAAGGGGGEGADGDSGEGGMLNQQAASPTKLRPEQLWANLTPFPYQKDIFQVVDAMGLSRRFGHLQDRVIFFRPCVKRKCPNGIMTDRVVFITPNGVLHLCDNDATPKRTLELPQLLSVVTDSISQIALITDWPLVLRFDVPKYAAQLPFQLPVLKQLVSLVKFFRPNTSLLRCTPEDFATVNLNLGKPRQFRAPHSFDVLAPPPERPLSAIIEETQHQHGGKRNADGSPAQQQHNNNSNNQHGASSPASSPMRRQVQFSTDVNVAEAMPGDIEVGGAAAIGKQGSPATRAGGGVGAGGARSPAMRRPDAPTGPTDFWAVQQGALFDHMTRDTRLDAVTSDDDSKGGGGAMYAGGAATPVDNKVDKPFRREIPAPAGGGGSFSGDDDQELPPLQQIVLPDDAEQQQQQYNQHQQQQSLERNMSTRISGAQLRELYQNQSLQQSNDGTGGGVEGSSNKKGGASSTTTKDPMRSSLGAAQFGQGGPSELLGTLSTEGGGGGGAGAAADPFQHLVPPAAVSASGALSSEYGIQQQTRGGTALSSLTPQQIHAMLLDHPEYYTELPTRFAGRTSDEVAEAVDAVQRLERHNDELRNEVFELELREKRMMSAPVPMGRVVPAQAAIEGAKVRNLGVLVMSICRRRKQLNVYESQSAANQSLLQQTSTVNSEKFEDI